MLNKATFLAKCCVSRHVDDLGTSGHLTDVVWTVCKSWLGIFRCFALDIFQQCSGRNIEAKRQPAEESCFRFTTWHCPDKPKYRLIYKRQSLFWGFFPWIVSWTIRSPLQLTHLVFFVIEFEFYIKKPNKPYLGCAPLLCLFGVFLCWLHVW